MKQSSICWMICCALLPMALCAEVSLPSFFSDNMVLQQQSQVRLWGTATPNKMLTIQTEWDHRTHRMMADHKGRWDLTVTTPAAGGPYCLSFDDGSPLQLQNVMIGEVWFCSGQSNMEQPMKGYTSQSIEGATRELFLSTDADFRLFTVARQASGEPLDNVQGQWQQAQPESVRDFCATAYYFGRFLRRSLNVPVGLIVSSWGGTPVEAWMSREALAAFPEVSLPAQGATVKGGKPTALFNGMVHPFLGMAMKGVIWYQGESNYDRPESYADLFVQMVSTWRNEWGIGEFPFYYCQIAPYDYSLITRKGEAVINSAYLREAQLQAEERLSNAAMVVLLDAGLEQGIHPRKKQVAGERLAMHALAGSYGYDINVRSPRFASMDIRDSVAVLHFDRSPLYLDLTQGKLEHFVVAGADSVFYPAQALMKKNTIEVWSDKVAHPVAVRYGFSNWVEGDVFGNNEMPVSSFRTDNWPRQPERIK